MRLITYKKNFLMELVGQILKKNRETKRINLLDVCKELKISEEILSNIENNHFQNKIANVYILGHLGSYCSFLDLDKNKLIEQFKNEQLPKAKTKIDIERPKFKKNSLFSYKVLSVSLILIIFSTFYFLFIEVEKPSREYAIIPDLPENYISIIEKASLDNLTENNNNNNSKEVSFAELEESINSSSAIASLPIKSEKNNQIITLKFLDDTWFQLRNKNNEIIFSQLMNSGEEYSYNLDSNYSITSGNAGHILVLIDQKVRGKIGKKGQVVDSVILNKDFNN